jgi:outer membrane receptor protein involved in Fe transport
VGRPDFAGDELPKPGGILLIERFPFQGGNLMRLVKVGLLLAAWTLLSTGFVSAQSTTGTISGHVSDSQGLAVPGVTVSVSSPNLQGVRGTVTSEIGDYLVTLLPSGTYTITFELSGFQKQEKTVMLAPTQVLPVDAMLGPAALTEQVTVVGTPAHVLTQTAQVATNLDQDLIASLPTTRDLNASVLQAPGVHATGPNGAYSIAGSTSFESLFMVNGVAITENLRGTAYDLYVEDAIQETTVSVGGVSAEYGRFSGGVVNVITKSGGNLFSGSFRDTYNNDKWRTLTPFESAAIAKDPQHKELRIDKSVPAYEYTAGGPVMKDRLWFFTAGRIQTQTSGRTLNFTNIPYTYSDKTRRYEGKATYSATSSHRIQANFLKIQETQINNTFNQNASMDARSLGDRKLPESLYTLSYSGVLTPRLFVEGRYSTRNFSFVGSGAKSTDRIEGTLLIDQSRNGSRYWSDTFCGICTPEERNNQEFFVKGSFFLSTRGTGTHVMVFGYDNFDDIRSANNHQSGSDFRILGTSSYVIGSGPGATVVPQFLGNDTTFIQHSPIPLLSNGSNFRTHSLFYNDAWRLGNRLTANLGVRWDKNHGLDQSGALVTKDGAFSPRLGIIWDPTGVGVWSVTGSFARYVSAISNSIADQSSAAGNPQSYLYYYRGPSINATGPDTSTPDAIKAVFDWYDANTANLVLVQNPNIPGLTPQIGPGLHSPFTYEYSSGVSRQLGNRASVRADVTYRKYHDFYASIINGSTGKVTNAFGQSFDLALIENTDLLKRQYSGLTTQGEYRLNASSEVGGQYTLSHAWGNFEGENVGSGPINSGSFQYPEYKQASWNYPEGDLQIDQRHRARMWLTYGVPHVKGLGVSLLETLESGVPYGASNLNSTGNVNGINPRPYVTGAPPYVNPPSGANTLYFYTARDAFRSEAQKRTDFAASYTHSIPGVHGLSGLQVFGQVQVINLFNQFQLCGCGGTVFQNGGATTQTRIDTAIRTSVTNPTLYSAFNPFTTTPVQGVNWDYGPTFGTALNRLAYTSPRQFRVSFGVRF